MLYKNFASTKFKIASICACTNCNWYLSTTYNLLTKFHTKKFSPLQFINFLTWYEFTTSTWDSPWQMKFIGNLVNLITWVYLQKVSDPQITYKARHQTGDVMYCLLLSRVITVPSFNFIPYVKVKISGSYAHASTKLFMYKVRRVKSWL